MNLIDKAKHFTDLHFGEAPLVLYNVWDAGSAKAIRDAGAPAIATSSWAVAAAHGYEDGEVIPIDLAEQIVARIVANVDCPVTIDFEGGYSDNDRLLATNVSRLLDLGVVGVNFEDRMVHGTGLYAVGRQAKRIAAIRKIADARAVPLFINARTDLFLLGNDNPSTLKIAAQDRANAYASAGASGFFAPGLRDDELIGELCASTALPVNVMVVDGLPSVTRLAELGVARVSYGPAPFIGNIKALKEAARVVYRES